MSNKRENIIAVNNRRCILALIMSAIVICCVFTGVVTKLVAESTAADPDEGIRSFRYFTVLSNMLVAFGATLCIPFQIDGLRNHNYHLPRWAIETLYIGVCCITVTFTVAVCLLAPLTGVRETLFQKANLYLHFIGPISAMILFVFINDDHRISFRHSFFVLLPLLAYAAVYWFQVFFIGEANGGWRDLYYTNTYFPYWIALIMLPVLGMTLANIMRVLHNKRHRIHKAQTEEYYLCSPDFECADIKEAVSKLAEREKILDRGGEIVVPRRLILMLEERYKSGISLQELCTIYIEAYLNGRK